MHAPRFRLRTLLTATSVIFTLLVLILTASLLVTNHYAMRVSNDLATAVESVRFSEETQVALLRHERTDDALQLLDLEEEMLSNLAGVRRNASPELLGIVSEAEAAVATYLAERSGFTPPSLRGNVAFADAFRVLDDLSDLHIERAYVQRDTAARWDARFDRLAVALGVSGLLLALALSWWLQVHAFRPVFGLANAMERFGRGDLSARAEERGPAELRDMIARFNRLADALAERRRAQVAFLAGVAHDLRNPLSALSLSVSLIDPEQPLPPESRIRRTFEIVRRQLTKLERMVDDFMELSRVQAGQLDLHFSRQDVGGLVREVVQLFEATEPSQRIELSLANEPLYADCDPLRIEQVVSNLVSNALKYSPSATKIEVSVAREGEYVTVRVRDFGIGITHEDQRRLFEPFRRAQSSKDDIPGAGLGLFVVRRLVEGHHGNIEVSSAPGEGTTVVVRLPREQTALSVSEPPPALGSGSLEGGALEGGSLERAPLSERS